MLHSVAVYCGSSPAVSKVYLKTAFETGRLLAGFGIDVVYGGGKAGLMGAVADGALEARGRVFGYMPTSLIEKEKGHAGITELHIVESMHMRKCSMFDHAEAFIVLPGGFGTLDEAFELLTWHQIGLHEKPVVFVNVSKYWDPLLDLIHHMEQEQFIRPEDRQKVQVATTPEAAIELLRQNKVSHFVSGSHQF